MSAIATNAAGAWSTPGTWIGGVIPGNGDTVTLNHAVSLTDARTVGASPAAGAGTNAIRCNATLTITGTGSLVCRGDIGLDTGGFVMQAGAVFEFDASVAASPSTALYIIGAVNFNPGAGTITISGSSGSRCTFRSNAGGGNGRIANLESGIIDATYCDFTRIGDASNKAYLGAGVGGQLLSFQNCTFDATCGQIGDQVGVASASDSLIKFINVTHLGTACLGIPADVFTTGGVRTISGCRFAGDVLLYRIDGYDFSDSVFEGNFDMTGGPWKSWSNMMLAMPSTANDYQANGPVLDTYVLRVGAPVNQHGLTIVDGNSGTFDGVLFDMPDGTDGAGDCITANAPSAPQTITVKRCIVLPSEAGLPTGTLLSCLGGPNLSVVYEHNTAHEVGLYVGETYSGYAGMVVSCRSNLGWSATANAAKVMTADAGVATNVALPANVRNNGKWNPLGTGYDTNLSFTGGAPGTADVSGDPSFVDRTRNIKKWDLSLGGPGTVANAVAELRKKNNAAGYNSAYTIANLLTYVRAGFAPQNAAYLRAGHDDTTIGAVYVAVTPPTVQRRRLSPTQRG